ncbi:MAG: hypothetical protein QOH50_584 [Kribbellaceae bacterium]|jgi:hypothetical protein|nr:hypothetical protein [Kribbellaceae bacterium]
MQSKEPSFSEVIRCKWVIGEPAPALYPSSKMSDLSRSPRPGLGSPAKDDRPRSENTT